RVRLSPHPPLKFSQPAGPQKSLRAPKPDAPPDALPPQTPSCLAFLPAYLKSTKASRSTSCESLHNGLAYPNIQSATEARRCSKLFSSASNRLTKSALLQKE